MKGWRRLLVWLGLLGILAGCSGEPPVSVTIGVNRWLGYEPLFVARANQSLPSSVRLAEFTSTSEGMRAFRNGALDAVAVTLDEALSLAQLVPDLSIGLVVDYSDGADVLLARPGLKRVEDMVGRRVGVDSLVVGAYLLGRAFDSRNLDISQTRIVHVPMGRHDLDFSALNVDALVTFEPYRSQQLARGAVQIFSSANVPGEITDVLVFRRSLPQDKQRQLQQVAQTWFDAVDRLLRYDPAAIAVVAERQALTPSQVQEALEAMKFPGIRANRTLLNPENSELNPVLVRLAARMREMDLLTRPVRLDTLLDDRLVREVKS